MRGFPFLLVIGFVFGSTGCGSGQICLDGIHDEKGNCVTDESIDSDGDGVSEADDCDDTDASIGAVADDADCDGAVTAADCDDTDALSTIVAEDADCDGVLTPDDCDDTDASSTTVAEDADCDGSVTAEDCDDTNTEIYPGAPEIWNDGIDQDCDGMADAANATCTSSFEVRFPDGSSTTLDGCLDWDIALEHEFDANAPPKVDALKITFGAGTAADLDCEIEVEQAQVCGTGFYDAANAVHSTTFSLVDCSGVANEYADSYRAYFGYLELTRVDSGTTPGEFTDLPLSTAVEGYLSVEERNGISVSGSFALSLEMPGVDDEQNTDCAVTDGDEDGDGHIDVYYAGDDCDDDDSDTYPGAPDTWYDGIDSNCDEANDFDADADGFDSYLHSGTDCDDTDPNSATQATDGDCDGFLTADDCDDNNADINPGATDTWYDGIDSDCDLANDYDADADGYDSNEHSGTDCDDTDPSSTTETIDADCDGVLTANDCDDTDAGVGDNSLDADCDGTLTADDCDDNNADLFDLTIDGTSETLSTGTYAYCDVNILNSATLVIEGEVEIEAESFTVEAGSNVDGIGGGEVGGDYTDGGGAGGGIGGTNAGAGGGGHGSDGGVGGYDDDGQDSPGSGGVEYGDSDTYAFSMGSGGGSTYHFNYESGAGGNGGSGLRVVATTITVAGTIDVSGDDAEASTSLYYGGGGGAGGGLLLHGDVITIDGDLLAAGGTGGNTDSGVGDAGGGGAGGRIKVFWGTSLTGFCSAIACWNVTGGTTGTGQQEGAAGGDGTAHKEQYTWP